MKSLVVLLATPPLLGWALCWATKSKLRAVVARHGQQLGCGLIRCRYEELDILGLGQLVGTCHVSLS